MPPTGPCILESTQGDNDSGGRTGSTHGQEAQRAQHRTTFRDARPSARGHHLCHMAWQMPLQEHGVTVNMGPAET